MAHAMKMTKIKEDKDFPITQRKNEIENVNVCRAVKNRQEASLVYCTK